MQTYRRDRAQLRGRVNLLWLLKLRWGAVLGQLGAIGVVLWFFALRLPWIPLLAILATMALTNVALAAWAWRVPKVPEAVLGGVMILDIVLLTVQLYLTGGSDNPFQFVYIIHIALAAVILPAGWGWAIAALASSAFVSLWSEHLPFDDGLRLLNEGLPPRLLQSGRTTAFALTAAFVVHFVHRCTAALGATEAALVAARERAQRHEKLTSLSTLAAGAAHELATPLATIAVIAKELERQLGQSSDSAREDAWLIRQEVERCRRVLAQMAADAGESTGEPLRHVSADKLVVEALSELAGHEQISLDIAASAHNLPLWLPTGSISQAIRAAAKNAMEASEPNGSVTMRVWASSEQLHIEVRDAGTGMSCEVLERIGEPFFTTKSPGRGMGLGLFLSRTVLEGLGGALTIDSRLGEGTRLVLTMPLFALAAHTGVDHGPSASDFSVHSYR